MIDAWLNKNLKSILYITSKKMLAGSKLMNFYQLIVTQWCCLRLCLILLRINFMRLTIHGSSRAPVGSQSSGWPNQLHVHLQVLGKAKAALEDAESQSDLLKNAKQSFYEASKNLRSLESEVRRRVGTLDLCLDKIFNGLRSAMQDMHKNDNRSSLEVKLGNKPLGLRVNPEKMGMAESLCSAIREFQEFGPIFFAVKVKNHEAKELLSGLIKGLNRVRVARGLLNKNPTLREVLDRELMGFRGGPLKNFLSISNEEILPIIKISKLYSSFGTKMSLAKTPNNKSNLLNRMNGVSEFFSLAVLAWNIYRKHAAGFSTSCINVLDSLLNELSPDKKTGFFLSLGCQKIESVGVKFKERQDFFAHLLGCFDIINRLNLTIEGKEAFVQHLLEALDYVEPVLVEYEEYFDFLVEAGDISVLPDTPDTSDTPDTPDTPDAPDIPNCAPKKPDENKRPNGWIQLRFLKTSMCKSLMENNLDDFLKLRNDALVMCDSLIVKNFQDFNDNQDNRNLCLISIDYLSRFKSALSEEPKYFFTDAYKEEIANVEEAEKSLNGEWEKLSGLVAEQQQTKALVDARRNYIKAVHSATEFLQASVLNSNRFTPFARKHLELGYITLKERLDNAPQIPASSAYFNELSMLMALEDISAHVESLKTLPTNEFEVTHRETVGLSVVRKQVDNNGELIRFECNASRVCISKGGQVKHIFPCYIPPDNSAQVQADQHTAGPSASAGPIHPTVAAHLREQLPTSKGKGKGGKIGKR